MRYLFARCVVLGVCAACAVTANAQAQTYPVKTVRIVVPFAAGGGTDIIARLVAQKLTESLGQTFIVDNRAGANGIIGTELVAKAPADGYTLMLGTSATHAINPTFYSKLSYDAVKEFAPVTNIAYTPFILSVHPSIPARNIKELIALAKARPGELSYASAGMGNSTHLAGELFCMLARVRMTHIPYKGSGPAMTDTLAGQTAATFDSMQASMPHIKVNRLRPLAITAAKRSPVIADLPTIAEAGVPGAEAGTWYGMLAPAATPRAVVLKLNAEVIKALAQPDARDRLATVGVDAIGNTPEQFADEIKSDILKWGKTIRTAHVRAD
jgi:tripartite-type tricarboxylate transporter receptor subunit TctC